MRRWALDGCARSPLAEPHPLLALVERARLGRLQFIASGADTAVSPVSVTTVRSRAPRRRRPGRTP